MGNFIGKDQFVRHFTAKKENCVMNVGYDDFSCEKLKRLCEAEYFYVKTTLTFHIVVSGKGTLRIYDKCFDISEGQIFFVPPGVNMNYRPSKDEPWEYVWFTVKNDLGMEYAKMMGFSENEMVKDIPQYRRVNKLLKEMLEHLMSNDDGYFKSMSTLYELLEICTRLSQPTGIQGVKSLIDDTFALTDFSVEQLCRDVGISHAHLLRQFKSEYGITVIRYVLKKRIELACELLLTTDLSVNSVAYSCGFNDELHFMKTFKREMGVSALNYKKNNKKTDKTLIKGVDL